MSDELEQAIVRICPEMSDDAVCDTIMKVDAMVSRAKELKSLLEKFLLDRIVTTGRDIEMGTVRYYAGNKKVTKCVNLAAGLQALLEVTGGDFEKFCEFFASQPLKHGACRGVLAPDVYDTVFTTETQTVLSEVKAVKQLIKMDTAFQR